ncbi:hypothetical protein JAU75_11275 [Ochrobactrum sp. Q0168]|uniref:hypothetical protein n=1 Tax=Ochrobactrum sp. Q0168 TaxID=2793241 RepID=UPI0018EB21AB|nr:hypothetical protein [Ochrobactrum sp. Q0168]
MRKMKVIEDKLRIGTQAQRQSENQAQIHKSTNFAFLYETLQFFQRSIRLESSEIKQIPMEMGAFAASMRLTLFPDA